MDKLEIRLIGLTNTHNGYRSFGMCTVWTPKQRVPSGKRFLDAVWEKCLRDFPTL